MPRTAIYTPEEIKQRRYERNKQYIKNRCANDPDFKQKQCEYVKKCQAKKNEELKKLRQFYEEHQKTKEES